MQGLRVLSHAVGHHYVQPHILCCRPRPSSMPIFVGVSMARGERLRASPSSLALFFSIISAGDMHRAAPKDLVAQWATWHLGSNSPNNKLSASGHAGQRNTQAAMHLLRDASWRTQPYPFVRDCVQNDGMLSHAENLSEPVSCVQYCMRSYNTVVGGHPT